MILGGGLAASSVERRAKELDLTVQVVAFEKIVSNSANTILEPGDDGTWTLSTWNVQTQAVSSFVGRHVVLSLHRMPSFRPEIVGNTNRFARRLDDVAHYRERPAFIVGCSTPAIEAVIELALAKKKAKDVTPVYWSFSGKDSPELTKGIASCMKEVTEQNGNVHALSNSRPVAVITGPDQREYLLVRINQQKTEHGLTELTMLEFPAETSILFSEENDLYTFLHSLGITWVDDGGSKEEKVVLTPMMETSHPNVYLVGEILSDDYWETGDFKTDPSTFRIMKRGKDAESIKRDADFLAEIIKQKCTGTEAISLLTVIPGQDEAEEMNEIRSDPDDTLFRTIRDVPSLQRAPGSAEQEIQALLMHLSPGDLETGAYEIRPNHETTIGSQGADISISNDAMLSDTHVSILSTSDGILLRDEASPTGTFLQLHPGRSVSIQAGDIIRLGKQFLLFESKEDRYSIIHYDNTGAIVNRHPIPEGTIVAGRQAPDLTLDSYDKILSRRHIAISVKSGKLFIKDLKSLNHTYLRIRGTARLRHDDIFRIGQQVFRLSLKIGASDAPVAQSSETAPEKTSAGLSPFHSETPTVTFRNLNKTIPIIPGQTLCEAAETAGITFDAECRAGICGSDPVRIVSGGAYLNDVGDEETDTLDDICGLQPGNSDGKYRLACMLSASGPVVVERVES